MNVTNDPMKASPEQRSEAVKRFNGKAGDAAVKELQIRADERKKVIAEIRPKIWILVEWAYREGQGGGNWGDYTGLAAEERIDALLGKEG